MAKKKKEKKTLCIQIQYWQPDWIIMLVLADVESFQYFLIFLHVQQMISALEHCLYPAFLKNECIIKAKIVLKFVRLKYLLLLGTMYF